MRLTKYFDTWVYKHDLSELEELYRNDLQVNRNKLEKAAQEQATKFEKWYSALEDVEGDLRDTISELNNVKAVLNIKIRAKYDKITESAVNARIEKSKKVVSLIQRVNMIKRYYGRLKGAVEAARQRKSMIQVLKDLYVANYWDKTTELGTPIHGRRPLKKRRENK